MTEHVTQLQALDQEIEYFGDDITKDEEDGLREWWDSVRQGDSDD